MEYFCPFTKYSKHFYANIRKYLPLFLQIFIFALTPLPRERGWGEGNLLASEIPKHPILYVVGMGDPGNAGWRDFTQQLWPNDKAAEIKGILWDEALNNSGPPDFVVAEIEKKIPLLQKNYFNTYHPIGYTSPDQINVILYGRSYGAVAVRDYLSRHLTDHHVCGVLFEAGPQQGADITRLKAVDDAFIWGGAGAALATSNPANLIWSGIGIAIPWLISNIGGLEVEAGGLYAVRPNSFYLNDLKHRPLPKDITYINVVEDCGELPARFLNAISFNLTSGDGCIATNSQHLSADNIANYAELNIKEVNGQVFHWTFPEASLPIVKPLIEELEAN